MMPKEAEMMQTMLKKKKNEMMTKKNVMIKKEV